jgi:DNA-binding response OmpR family regulator
MNELESRCQGLKTAVPFCRDVVPTAKSSLIEVKYWRIVHMTDEQPAKKLILVVEDDQFIGELIKDTLTAEPDYQASVVGDGAQALDLLRQLKVQLIILDINLPGITGYEVFDKIRDSEEFGHPKILFMSAGKSTREARQRGVEHYLAKPFDLDTLLATVCELMENGDEATP